MHACVRAYVCIHACVLFNIPMTKGVYICIYSTDLDQLWSPLDITMIVGESYLSNYHDEWYGVLTPTFRLALSLLYPARHSTRHFMNLLSKRDRKGVRDIAVSVTESSKKWGYCCDCVCV